MPDVFISYARPDAEFADAAAQRLRAEGYEVWRDDELPAHRPYGEVLEERLRSSKAVIVLWSAQAIKSQWVRAEADLARTMETLVQGSLDGSALPLPFNQIHCADLRDWPAGRDTPGWDKLLASVAELVRSGAASTKPSDARHGPVSSPNPPARARPILRVGPLVSAPGTDATAIENGFREEIISALGRQPTIDVATDELPAGGRGLDADYRLDGTLQRSGKRLRLNFRLNDRAASAQLWTERYEADADDLFDAQDRIALAVASAVEAAIKTVEIERAARLPTAALSTHQIYLRALAAQRAQDRDGCLTALAMFEDVITREPTHAHALANAALCHYNIHLLGWWDNEEQTREAGSAYALRSLRLSDNDAYSAGLCALALAQFNHPIDVSLSLIDRLIGLNPALAVLWHWSGMLRLMGGDLALAEQHFGRCITLDPRTPIRPIVLAGLGGAQMLAGRHEAAITVLQESISLRGQSPLSRVFLAVCYGLMGRIAEARAARLASETIAPVERFRFPFRASEQRALFEHGLSLAGSKGEVVLPRANDMAVQGAVTV